MSERDDPRRVGRGRPASDEVLEDLVVECLDAADPTSELLRRTEGCPALRARARRVLARVLREERRER